jgi:O-Antigen ligase
MDSCMNLGKMYEPSDSIDIKQGRTDQQGIAHANEHIKMWCAISLLGLSYVGYIKGSPLLNWLPVDATAILAASSLAAWLVYVQRTRRPFVISMRFAAILWMTFLIPGAILNINSDLDVTKTIYLFTITLLCVLLPSVIGNSIKAQRAWLFGHLIVGLALGIGILLFPDKTSFKYYGGLDIVGGTTITTARAAGAMFMILAIFAMHSSRWRVPCLVGAALVLVVVIQIGSRGPLISLILALPIVVLTSKLPRRERLAGVGFLATLALFFVATISNIGSAGASRLLVFVSGDTTDTARSALADIAIRHITSSPFGIGWSGFAQLPEVRDGVISAFYPHNMFLEIFVEGGWIAGIAFVAFVIAALRNLRMASSTPAGILFYGLALYWLLAAQFSSDINGNRMTWAALSFGFATVASRSPVQRRPQVKALKTG